MSATQQVPDTQGAAGPDRVRRSRKPWLILAAVAVAVALFLGGVFVARSVLNDKPDPISSAAEGLVLQQLVLQSQEADGIIKQVSQVGSDQAALTQLAISLQTVAVQMGELADDATSPELQELTRSLSDAYLTIGVGLITNSPATVNTGVALLKDAQSGFSDYLGVDSATPSPTGTPAQPTPSPGSSQLQPGQTEPSGDQRSSAP